MLYCEQEQYNVIIMNFKNLLFYVQYKINNILC